ncbi:helix-turn-helix transcriptional regulator [Streptomyces cocklensis]|jgi:transcriptional regulator with XRE-family HTH domain|uniref:Helix-turn-helix domain-containing protein n=1 Tax=Actinacidiphila cocklensis TaxID=887465 RepID=A0A9W4DPJ2_9ACTN|nr:helix-turn-helix transcriptional regulator [Actinacidiphila cocklensis]MDD1057610.1 helix-turn-helix transcriptional regulator [Actinacidiphila cocklensis]CAG6393758.1 Helix-turn-helix domain-containing protein [Actinacidiphila cocklensis]
MNGNGDDDPSARAVFRRELSRRRESSGWTLAQLSDKTRYDTSYLQRLEKGGRLGSLDAACALDRVYDAGDLLANLWRLAKREARQSRYQGFTDLEADATGVQEFSISTVPGLLQTPRYAEALLRTLPISEEALPGEVQSRIARQELLTGSQPLHYRGLLDESVIRRPARNPEVWTEQLGHLVEAAQRPNISLQMVPYTAGLHDLLGSSLQLLWLASGQMVAYIESSRFGQLIDDVDEVEHLRLSYDRLRDSALSTAETLGLLRDVLEDRASCSTPRQT